MYETSLVWVWGHETRLALPFSLYIRATFTGLPWVCFVALPCCLFDLACLLLSSFLLHLSLTRIPLHVVPPSDSLIENFTCKHRKDT